MRRVPIYGLGLAYTSSGMAVDARARQVNLTRRVYGVAIAPDSELDQCSICVRGDGLAGRFVGDLRPLDVFITAVLNPLTVQTVKSDFVKIGVGAPFVGVLDTRALIVAATRGVQALTQNASPAPALVLDLAETPEEAVALAARSRRAPLDLDFSGGLEEAGSIPLVFSTYGRSWWSLYLRMLSVTGTPTRTSIIKGYTEPLVRGVVAVDEPTGLWCGAPPKTLQTDTGTAAITVDVEMDSSFDRIGVELTVAGAAGEQVKYFGRFRAEDR